jgi:uncharacterized coiled-coil protein SlyX
MITTLRAIRVSFAKSLIIGLLALLLGGCTAVRLGYNNGAQLTWWWLDGYADFSSEQAPAAKLAIDRWFEWHRSTQLPEYAAVLASAQVASLQPTTPAAVCQWQALVRDKLEPAIERALLQLADLLPGMGEAQFRHIEQRYAKNLTEMREEYLQADAAARQKQTLKRALDRAEQLYGRLDEAQRRVISAGAVTSPFDPQAWLTERQSRQRDTVQTLRRLAAERADRDQRVAALRALAERTERSPNPEYRAYQQRLAEYNCGWFAQLHNATTPAQRQRARETLKGWEDDLRSLVGTPPA